jgi:hypothetical protein
VRARIHRPYPAGGCGYATSARRASSAMPSRLAAET